MLTAAVPAADFVELDVIQVVEADGRLPPAPLAAQGLERGELRREIALRDRSLGPGRARVQTWALCTGLWDVLSVPLSEQRERCGEGEAPVK